MVPSIAVKSCVKISIIWLNRRGQKKNTNFLCSRSYKIQICGDQRDAKYSNTHDFNNKFKKKKYIPMYKNKHQETTHQSTLTMLAFTFKWNVNNFSILIFKYGFILILQNSMDFLLAYSFSI